MVNKCTNFFNFKTTTLLIHCYLGQLQTLIICFLGYFTGYRRGKFPSTRKETFNLYHQKIKNGLLVFVKNHTPYSTNLIYIITNGFIFRV